jgi:glycosyltransferase involved in cell wall biosynthesis
MRVAVLTGSCPNPTSGGGALTAWSVVKSLLLQGCRVHVVCLETALPSASEKRREEQVERLSALGASHIGVGRAPSTAPAAGAPPRALRIGARIGRLGLRPQPLEKHFPSVASRDLVEAAVANIGPDVVFMYHFEPLAAGHRIRGVPLFAGVGDPVGLPDHYRWRLQTPPRLAIAYARDLYRRARARYWQRRHMRSMLQACDGCGAFAAHHAEWFRRIGVGGCEYLRTPVPADGAENWRERRRSAANPKPRLLLLGHLKGIATLSGLDLFARSALPRLERALGPDGFQVDVVGGFDPPPELREALARPSISWCGQIEPADEKILAADVLVVPTPIRLGIRVRILTGLAFGSCIVTHEANAAGIPELRHGVNALLAADGPGLADSILLALGDAATRARLQEGARATYDAAFSLHTAGRAIVERLERLAVDGRGRAQAVC